MNLLPKTREEFAQSDYWNAFFKKRGDKAFEWYGEYLDLCEYLHKYIKTPDKILMLGCGNSKLSNDMYDAGFRDIISIDVSPIAIKKMLDSNARVRPDMKFLQMDATAMSFDDETFTVALDKGTLDALFTDDSKDVRATVERYFVEVSRTMRIGGRYLCITLLQEHILNYVLEHFPSNSFMLRVVHCVNASQAKENKDAEASIFPIFMIVATKFKSLPSPILEFSLDGNKMQRVKSAQELKDAVLSVQKAALVCNSLNRSSIAGQNEISMDLFKPADDTPRYTVHVLDQPPARNMGKYAAFIVPQGREIEWLFSTPQGRKKLSVSANFQRLAIVTLHRDQDYESLDLVKAELTDSIRNLAPAGIKEQIPFLSLGEDVGRRETLVTGFSKISGKFQVEEVEGGSGKLFRRLIFLDNQFVVQSEALIKTIKLKGKKEKKKIDVGYLACQHHLYMSVGVQLATKIQHDASKSTKDVLIIGLGGGGLCSFLHAALTDIRITAVEIDPLMLEIAEQYFELKQDKRLHVVIDDGLQFMERCKTEGAVFDAVLFDVDSKDITLGMSCPPQSFLEANVLSNVKSIIAPKGVFILNLVCRDEILCEQAIKGLQATFSSVCSYKLSEDVNEVVFCSMSTKHKGTDDWRKAFGLAGRGLINSIKQQKLHSTTATTPRDDDILDVTGFLNDLRI